MSERIQTGTLSKEQKEQQRPECTNRPENDTVQGESTSTAAPSPSHPGHLILVMGVSACGKTTVGIEIAARLPPALHARFIDADTYHSQANIEKMSRGEGLTDTDRESWLHTLASLTRGATQKGETIVLGCSALKRSYRKILFGIANTMEEANRMEEEDSGLSSSATSITASSSSSSVSATSSSSSSSPSSSTPPPPISASSTGYVIYLHGSKDLMHERIRKRSGHFAKSNLLDSQFETLERPTEKEGEKMNVKVCTVELGENRTPQEEAQYVVDWMKQLK